MESDASENLIADWNKATQELQERARQKAEREAATRLADLEAERQRKEQERLAKEAVEKAKEAAEKERLALVANRQAEERAARRADELAECGDDKEKLYALAKEYESSENGEKADRKHAVEIYKRAARLEHQKAAWGVTYAYFVGYGIEKDLDVATEYARIMFKLGYRNLGDSAFGIFFQWATQDLQEVERERVEAERKLKEDEEKRRTDELLENHFTTPISIVDASNISFKFSSAGNLKAAAKVYMNYAMNVNTVWFNILFSARSIEDLGCYDMAIELFEWSKTHPAIEHFKESAFREIERLSRLAQEQRNRTSEEVLNVGELRRVDKKESEKALPAPEEDTQSSSDASYGATPGLASATLKAREASDDSASVDRVCLSEGETASESGVIALPSMKPPQRLASAIISSTRYSESVSEATPLSADIVYAEEAVSSIARVDIARFDWNPEYFAEARKKAFDRRAFDAGLRMIFNYGLRPDVEIDTHKKTTLREVLCEGNELKKDWLIFLHEHIYETYINTGVEPRSEEEFINALIAQNPLQEAYIRSELIPRMYRVLSFANEPLDDRSLNVVSWDKAQVARWCAQFKRLDWTTKENKATELLAVIVRAVKLTYGYEPHITQIFSVIANITPGITTGRFLQISTGEGKTLITAMTAAARALLGDTVDIASSSDDLCREGVKSQQGFYQLLTLDCADVSGEDANEIIKGYEAPIVYGTIHAFSAHMLNQTFLGQKRRGCRRFDVLLADEVDSLTIDQIDTFTQLSQPIPGTESLLSLLGLIYVRVDHYIQSGYCEDELKAKLLDFARSKMELPKYSTAHNIVEACVSRADEGSGDKPFPIVVTDQLKAFVEYQLPNWVESAIQARMSYREGQNHLVHTNGHVRPIDYQHTGGVHLNQVFSDGIHQFLQMSKASYVTAETVTGSFMSPLTYLKLYQGKIYGVTGTLGNDATQEFMSKVYKVDFIKVPTFKPNQFNEYEPNIQGSDWEQSIIDSIMDETQRGRAVLVLCETKQRLEAIEKTLRLKHRHIMIHTYSRNDLQEAEGKELTEEGKKLPKVLKEGEVLLATNLAGRGTDLQLSNEVKRNGGLHVCLTFLPLNERVEAQNFGRAARQGEKGSGQLIVNAWQSGYFIQGGNNTIQELKERRLSAQKERVSAIISYNLQEGQFQDDSFKQASEMMENLRGGYIDELAGTSVKEAKLDQLNQLWSLQYHLCRTYQHRIYTQQLTQLRELAAAKSLKIKEVYDDRPDQFIQMIAEAVDMPYLELKHQLIAYVWRLSYENIEIYKELITRYVAPTDDFFKACADILKTTLVILNQKDEYRVFKSSGKEQIVLGELTGGADAPSKTHLKKDWVIHDVLQDGNCLYHALGHQLSLSEHSFLKEDVRRIYATLSEKSDITGIHLVPEMQLLHRRIRLKVRGLKSPDGVLGELKDIQKFAKEFECIVAVVSEDAVHEGYTYYYHELGQDCVGSSSNIEEILRSEKPIYRIAAMGNIEKGGARFKSVVWDPYMTLDAPILPIIYDVIPSYRSTTKVLKDSTMAPKHVLKRYAIMKSTHVDESGVEIRPYSKTYRIPDEARVSYQEATKDYYQRYFAQERKFVDDVIRRFVSKSERLFKTPDGVVLSVPLLLKIRDHLTFNEWVERLTHVMGAEPQFRHAIYYAHAYKLTQDKPHNYKRRAIKALETVEEYSMQINEPWLLINSIVPMKTSDTSLAKQVAGRVSFIQRLRDNISANIRTIEGSSDQNSIELKEFEGFDFEKLGIITEDVQACRQNGVAAMYVLMDQPPQSTFFELFALTVMGLLQGIAGATLMMCGCVNLGAGLISESLSDLWLVIRTGANGAIDWAQYARDKAIAALVMIGAAAWSALSEGAKIAEVGVKETAKEGAKEVTKVVVEESGLATAKKLTTSELGWKAVTAFGKAAGSIALSEGLGFIRGQVIDRYQKEILEKAQEKVSRLFEDSGFKAELSQVMRFDGATSSQWKMRQSVYVAMETWEKSNAREALGIINKVMKIFTSSSKSDLTSMLTSVGGTMVIGGYNISVAYTFMDDYIKELKAKVHKVAEGLMKAAEVTETLCGVNSKDVAKWLAAVEKTGAIVGNKPYQLIDEAHPEVGGVNADADAALKGVLEATMGALSVSEVAARAHPLYRFGARLILSVHQIQAGDDKERTGKSS